MTVPPPTPPVAFVTCVEAGGLEQQVVRMARSLRRFGGRFAGAPVYAVRPRSGVPLARSTRAALDECGVTLRDVRPPNPYPWNAYLNKPLALIDVGEQTTATAVCWLDGDVLVTGEPALLALADDVDFTACAPDKNIGTAAPDDPFAPYWRAVCNALGTTVEQMPWVDTQRDAARIRLYFNSGVFAYRRTTGFAAKYLADCVRLLDARVASRESGIFFTDQVVLGLTMLGLGLRWRPLPHEYNYAVGRKILPLYDVAKVRAAVVLHYHDMLWPEQWPTILAKLTADRPDVHDWLAPQGPIRPPGSKLSRLAARWVGMGRKRKAEAFRAGCTVY